MGWSSQESWAKVSEWDLSSIPVAMTLPGVRVDPSPPRAGFASPNQSRILRKQLPIKESHYKATSCEIRYLCRAPRTRTASSSLPAKEVGASPEVEMGKEGAGNEIKMGLRCTSRTVHLGSPRRSVLMWREGCSGEMEAKCILFVPKRPPNQPRKYSSSQKIRVPPQH